MKFKKKFYIPQFCKERIALYLALKQSPRPWDIR